jgi:hypothetical protein
MLDQPASIARVMEEEERRHNTIRADGSGNALVEASSHELGAKVSLGANATAGRTYEMTVTRTRQGMEETRKVTARGSGSEPVWEIVEPEAPHLNGRYLGPENLCELALEAGPSSVTARFVCQKRDLFLEFDPSWRWRLSRNKEKIALALIAKRLKRDDVEDTIELCRSRLLYDHDGGQSS